MLIEKNGRLFSVLNEGNFVQIKFFVKYLYSLILWENYWDVLFIEKFCVIVGLVGIFLLDECGKRIDIMYELFSFCGYNLFYRNFKLYIVSYVLIFECDFKRFESKIIYVFVKGKVKSVIQLNDLFIMVYGKNLLFIYNINILCVYCDNVLQVDFFVVVVVSDGKIYLFI